LHTYLQLPVTYRTDQITEAALLVVWVVTIGLILEPFDYKRFTYPKELIGHKSKKDPLKFLRFQRPLQMINDVPLKIILH